MLKQGRVLIVDDMDIWLDTLSQVLTTAGFQVDQASKIEQARQLLDERFYHLLILDVRMDETDVTNEEGLELLKELSNRNLVLSESSNPGSISAMQVIMLTAHGNMERMRAAFKQGAVDFCDKHSFDKKEFLRQVQSTFTNKIPINLDLNITWEQVGGPEQVVSNLVVDGKRLKRHLQLQTRIVAELEDLLCRLFRNANSIIVQPMATSHSASVVLLVRPFFTAGAGQPVVVKFGDYHNINVEYDNYKAHVQPFIERKTAVYDVQRTPKLGGIVYTLVGAASEHLENFASFYARADVEQIKGVLDGLFFNTCGSWYASRSRLIGFDLTSHYEQFLGFTTAKLEHALTEGLKSVQGRDKLRFSSLKSDRVFNNPIAATAGKKFNKTSYECQTHGDLNESNILIDETGHTWLIDFDSTGPGHILRDVAELDGVVRFALLRADEATLEERLWMEEALIEQRTFGKAPPPQSGFQTENAAVAKAYAISLHLCEIAAKLVAQNPGSDVTEYEVALLYYAMNMLRTYDLPALQRQHALLSASLIAERLGL